MSSANQEVTRVVSAFADTWNAHDMEAFSRLFAEDAEFVNVVGMWWKGRAEIRKAHEYTHGTVFRDSRITLLETSVRFAGPTLAIARSRWRLEGVVSMQGEPVPVRTGLLVVVLANEGARWVMIDAQNTDVVERPPLPPR